MLIEDVTALRRAAYRILLVSESEEGAKSLVRSLGDHEIAAVYKRTVGEIDIEHAEGGRIFVTVGACEGFDLISPKIAVLSMARDEGRAIMAERRRRRIRKKLGGTGAILNQADLSPGDYVVHASYGIGLFEGIETVTVDGVEHRFENAWLAPMMNGRFYGGGMMATPSQVRNSGELSVMIFDCKSKLRLLTIFPSLFKGEHINHKKYVSVFSGKEITVKYDEPKPLQVDGETILGVTECRAKAYEKESVKA
jgi:hypothetical protein